MTEVRNEKTVKHKQLEYSPEAWPKVRQRDSAVTGWQKIIKHESENLPY